MWTISLTYALLDTAIVALLFHRVALRWSQHQFYSAGVVSFLSITYVHLALVRWGAVLGFDFLRYVNEPEHVYFRTVPLIVLLWASRNGRESFLPRDNGHTEDMERSES